MSLTQNYLQARLFWGAIKNFFKKLFKIIAFVALVAAVIYLAVTGIGLILGPGILKGILGGLLLFGASFLAAKVGATVYSRVKESMNRCDVPGFAGLSRARQDELTQRGVSPEQWNNLKNKQRLGYFNITAAIASAGLSLMDWLVDWATFSKTALSLYKDGVKTAVGLIVFTYVVSFKCHK